MGEFGSLMQVTSLPTSPEEYSANADLFWSHMSVGANGQRFGSFSPYQNAQDAKLPLHGLTTLMRLPKQAPRCLAIPTS